ncbi:MAG: T6SS effector amidase Tae4 family protein [Prevotella sp.]|nr:T6SS effector amidase Tae4 family protein [Prevotella sp.]
MRDILSTLFFVLLCLPCISQERPFADKELGGSNNGIVGKTDDEFNVTPTGQVSYSIPIPAVSGTGGIKPQLSVSYSSSTKNGLFGYGFDLTGLSIINRTPSNYFLDGMATAVDFTYSDHFALDGMRLVKCGNVDSRSIEYRTENNSFAKIVSYGDEKNPSSFTVYTKSGLIYEYSSNVSILNGSSANAIFWLVTKVSDTKGNYYKVSYGGDAETNDFWVTRIDYTGNSDAGLSPYASIRFTYSTNSYAPVTYIHGQKVRKSRIVSLIEIYSNGKRVRHFTIGYQTVNRKYQLSSITEYASDGTHKNPTRFTWNNLNDFSVTNIDYSKTSLIHKAKLTVGDFNGDGMADFIATPENDDAGWKGWKLFISHGKYFTQAATGNWQRADDEFRTIVCGDFNGDGYADVVVKRKVSTGYYNCDLYLASCSGDNVKLNYNKCIISLTQDYDIQPVEVNGDGATDLFLWLNDSRECRIIRSETGQAGLLPLNYTASRRCSVKWNRVEFGDFNGDGLTDVLNMDNDGHYLLQSDGYGTMSEVLTGAWPEKRHYIDFGDFNGDGKTDMLLTGWEEDPNADGWDNWCFLYSKGDGTFEKEYKTRIFDSRDKQMFIADINGDGFDDFHAVDKNSSGMSMTQPQVYLNDGRGNFYRQVKGGNVYALDKWHFYPGDFNGDGKTDFVCTSDWNRTNWDGYQLYLMPEDNNNLLGKITDGLGNETSITYKYLSDKSVCTRDYTKGYPLIACGSSWPVVASVTTPDGIGGKSVMNYKYGNALFHKRGRGFLCFETFTVKDEVANTTTVSKFEVNKIKYVVGLKSTQTYVGSTLVSQCDYVNSLSTNYNTNYSIVRRIYTFVPTEVRERSYEYNSGVLVSDVTTATEYDSYGNPVKTTVRSGGVTTVTSNTYTNDESKWHIGRLLASVVTKTDGNGSITRTAEFDYDAASGMLSAEYSEPDNAVLGYKKTYVHDTYGNIIQSCVIPNDGSAQRTAVTSYSGNGRFLVSATNSLGFTKTNTVDEELGLVTQTTDENGIVTTNIYDKFGRLQQSATPIAKSVHTTGWSNGMADAPSRALYFEYSQSTGTPYTIEFFDCLGRSLRKVTETLDNRKVYIDCVYNAKGEVEKTSEPYFPGGNIYWNTNEYDAAGRTVRQTAPDGSSHTIQYNGLTTVTTDPLGNTTTKTVDQNGNLVKSIDSEGAEVVYKYDAGGRCVEVIGPRTTIRMEYDAAGNRTKLDDPDLGVSEDTYNAYGELVTHEDAHGKTTYTYDAGGRVIKEERPDMTVNTVYDEGFKGKPSSVRLSGAFGGGKNWTYDGYGRVVKETEVIDRINFITETSYNALGLVDMITYPTGLKVKNNYASNGILTSISNATTGKVYWELKTLNARGQIEKELYGNGLATTNTYDDKRGLISGISTPGVQNWAYSFDAVGNLITRRDVSRNLSESFEYDGLYRLIGVRRNGQVTQTVLYDNAGNITYKSDVGHYNYEDGTNRLSSISGCVCQPKVWDEIKYNSFGKISYVCSGSSSMTLEYRWDGTRKKQTIGDKSRYYVGSLFEETIDKRDVTNINYVFASGKVVAIVEDKPGKGVTATRYVHHDHLGSIQAYSDENGSLTQELSYDAWGRRRNPDNWTVYDTATDAQAWQERGFGGHEHIDEFEMVNMDGRMYDPVVGRFLSPDPYVQMPDFTQSLNRYAYCVNNPLSLTDPSGYSWFSKNWKAITASVVGIAVSVVTLGSGSSIGAAIIAGVAGGAAGALTGALLNGSNLGQIAKSTFTGALWGGVSGFLNYASGGGTFLESMFKHTFSQGWLEGIQGGNMFHGFMMGAVSKAGGTLINSQINSFGEYGEIVANSILSGTIDEIGGGKFANGAITGAFSILFNDMMHRGPRYRQLKKIMDTYRQSKGKYKGPSSFYASLGGEIAVEAQAHPTWFENACAARLSYALNENGISIPYIPGQTMKGSDGKNYFLRAIDMKGFFLRIWGKPRTYSAPKYHIKNGIVYQSGFNGVTGHVDVFFNETSGGAAYLYYWNGDNDHKNIKTEIWKYGR